MTDRELMQMALDALEDVGGEWGFTSQRTLPKRMSAIEALRARLTQPEPAPVAKYSDIISDGLLDPRNKFDTAPPQREWQGLTDEEANSVVPDGDYYSPELIARNIEAKLKEKNV